MNFTQSVKIGLVELRSNKLRSLLTMLGVIFGVAAVVASVAIGEGAKRDALDQVALMGINTIRIVPVSLEGQRLALARQKNPKGLSRADADAVLNNCPYARAVTPLVTAAAKPHFQGALINGTVLGTTPNYLETMNFAVASGRFIGPSDMERAQRVCVIGAEIKEDLFPLVEPLGRTIIIGDGVYSVVGVMQDKRVKASGSGSVLRNLNRDIYIPLSAAIKRLGPADENNELSELAVRVESAESIMQAAELIGKIVLRTHGDIENFETVVPVELLKQSQAAQKRFNMVLAAVAGISLLVGGIGIMNIMLAGVTQRIREIGVRRALGASRQDILSQFLIEALVLSISGGIIGIAAGMLLGRMISLYAQWTTVYSLKAIIISFTVAAAVGVIFGIFPARRAANLNPIEALRYE